LSWRRTARRIHGHPMPLTCSGPTGRYPRSPSDILPPPRPLRGARAVSRRPFPLGSNGVPRPHVLAAPGPRPAAHHRAAGRAGAWPTGAPALPGLVPLLARARQHSDGSLLVAARSGGGAAGCGGADGRIGRGWHGGGRR
jgi:hypothetical protein